MEQDEANPQVRVRQLVDGYQVSQAVRVAAMLGVADLLVGGAKTSDDLAGGTGSDAPSLYRLLRALAADWPDDEAVQILEVVRQAIPDNGTLLAVERMIEPPNQGRMAKFSDLNMLVAPGGQERTTDEYARLSNGPVSC